MSLSEWCGICALCLLVAVHYLCILRSTMCSDPDKECGFFDVWNKRHICIMVTVAAAFGYWSRLLTGTKGKCRDRKEGGTDRLYKIERKKALNDKIRGRVAFLLREDNWRRRQWGKGSIERNWGGCEKTNTSKGHSVRTKLSGFFLLLFFKEKYKHCTTNMSIQCVIFPIKIQLQ